MRKKKYPTKKYANACTEFPVKGADETEYMVRNHISYDEKREMASEMAAASLVVHDEHACYESYERVAWEIYLIAKYYTDINTEYVEPPEIVNLMVNNEILERVREIIDDDFIVVTQMDYLMEKAVETCVVDDASVGKAVKQSFGFLFNGQDLSQTIAQAEEVKDQMYDAMRALQNENKETQTKLRDGTMNIGGKVLNFAVKD